MRVGLGATVLVRCGDEVDGIGIMVRNLQWSLVIQGITVKPWAFPGFLSNHHDPSRTQDFEYFPFSFNLSLLRTLLSGGTTPGSDALHAQVDLFHAADYRIPKLQQVPVVATLHDAIPLMAPYWVNPRLRRLKNLLLRRTSAWADHVIAISEAMVPDLVRYLGVREDAISVVSPGVDRHFFAPTDPLRMQQILDRYQLRSGYVLTVGTLQPRKNFVRLIRAHRSLPVSLRRAHPLVIVGRAGWRTEETLREIACMEATGDGHWLRFVPQQDLPALYRAARVFAFPSLYEGFGLPVLEAFASNVPVVTSATSALPEAAGDAAVLVNPESEGDIADALRTVFGDSGLARDLRRRGVERARRFSWERCATETVSVYHRVLSGA